MTTTYGDNERRIARARQELANHRSDVNHWANHYKIWQFDPIDESDVELAARRHRTAYDLERKRREHLMAMRDHALVHGPFLQWAVTLDDVHVRNCRLVPTRDHMLFGMPKGGVVAEVGTEYGLYTGKILEVCKPAAMHLIDRDFSVFAKERFAQPIAEGTLHFHEGDSSTLLGTFPDATFDWIYIDADHRYDGVSLDIRAAVPKVKPGGLLAFNDYTFWSPYEQSAYGVPAAIHELCIEDHWEFVFFAFEPRGYHDCAIRRIPR